MQIEYPFTLSHGRVATTTQELHVRQLIEQVLLTMPGERVNRPAFGAGVELLVFEPNSSQLAAATRKTVEGALQHILADLIQLESVVVEARDELLSITVIYVDRATQTRHRVNIER